MTEPTPGGPPEGDPVVRGGATRAPLAEGEEAEETPLERVKTAYEMVSDVLTPRTLGILGAALVLFVVGLLGGWRSVEVDRILPTVEVGTPVATGPFKIAVERAYVATELKPVILPSAGFRYLIVIARVTNTGTEPEYASLLYDVLHPSGDGIAADAKPELYRLTDGQWASMLQPGMTYELVCAWKQDRASPALDHTTLTFDQLTWRKSSMDASFGWLDPEPFTTVDLAVQQVPGS